MRRDRLTICVLLLSFVPAAVLAQSLGEVARKLREERREHPGPQLKVYTTEDLETPSEEAAIEGQEGAKTEASAAGKEAPAAKKGKKKPTLEEQMQQRSEEINKKYRDRIAKIRDQISQTQKDLEKLKRDRLATTYQFRTSNGISPSIYEYQAEMKSYEAQIEADNKQLESLKSDLEDAQEQARHAGVPHAYD
jgi:chromosome segregation ATPase